MPKNSFLAINYSKTGDILKRPTMSFSMPRYISQAYRIDTTVVFVSAARSLIRSLQ